MAWQAWSRARPPRQPRAPALSGHGELRRQQPCERKQRHREAEEPAPGHTAGAASHRRPQEKGPSLRQAPKFQLPAGTARGTGGVLSTLGGGSFLGPKPRPAQQLPGKATDTPETKAWVPGRHHLREPLSLEDLGLGARPRVVGQQHTGPGQHSGGDRPRCLTWPGYVPGLSTTRPLPGGGADGRYRDPCRPRALLTLGPADHVAEHRLPLRELWGAEWGCPSRLAVSSRWSG